MGWNEIGAAIIGLVVITTGVWSLTEGPASPMQAQVPEQEPQSAPDLYDDLEENEALKEIMGHSDKDGADAFSWELNDTAVVFNITNHSNETRGIVLASEVLGELPPEFMVWGKVYHEGNRAKNLFQYGFLGDPGFVGVNHGEVSIELPFGPVSVFGRAEEWSQQEDVEVFPGKNQMVISAQNVAMSVDIRVQTPLDDSLEIEVAHENPDMVQHRITHLEGHWDEVHLEVWGTNTGHVDATTRVKGDHSYRMLHLSTGSGLNELMVRDSDGSECTASTIPSDLHGAVIRMKPALGDIVVTGTSTTKMSPPWLFLIFYDLPVDYKDTWPDCYGFGDGSGLE